MRPRPKDAVAHIQTQSTTLSTLNDGITLYVCLMTLLLRRLAYNGLKIETESLGSITYIPDHIDTL